MVRFNCNLPEWLRIASFILKKTNKTIRWIHSVTQKEDDSCRRLLDYYLLVKTNANKTHKSIVIYIQIPCSFATFVLFLIVHFHCSESRKYRKQYFIVLNQKIYVFCYLSLNFGFGLHKRSEDKKNVNSIFTDGRFSKSFINFEWWVISTPFISPWC